MRILYFTAQTRNKWNGTLHKPLQRELNKRKGITIATNILPDKEINNNYDAFFSDVPISAKGWHRLKIPKIMFMEDAWMGGQKRKGKAATKVFKYADAIMVRYKSQFEIKLSRQKFTIKQPLFNLPHCISPQLFKDWKQEKIYDTLSVGTLTHKQTKDMREFFHHTTRKNPTIINYRAKTTKSRRFYEADKFSKIINQSKITGTTNTIWQVLAKCMEIPASRSLMFCNESYDMEELGFIDGETYVMWDKENLTKKLKFYLSNPDELKRVTDNGYKMVHDRHNVELRAQEWIEIMKEVVNK